VPAPASTGSGTGVTAIVPAGLDATVVLVRHGESVWVAQGRVQGRANPPLSVLGYRQAALVAARLAHPLAPPPLPVPAGRVLGCWHSTLDRAASTAAAISAACGPDLELHPDERLGEIGQGAWEGLTGAEVGARFPQVRDGWQRDPVHVHAPGGESLPEASRRAASFATELLARLTDVSPPGRAAPSAGLATAAPWAIVVSHDGLLRVLLLSLLGLPLDAFWRFPLGLCGISVVDVRGGRQSLRAHNVLDHLEPIGADAPAAAAADRGGAL
jgi:probable phosphoglycerate mutase